MTKYTNAKQAGRIVSQSAVFHIVITGHDEKTGITGFSEHKEHPRAWLVNKPYRLPVIRHLGAIQFQFHDYESDRNDWIYFSIAKQVMRKDGLTQS